MNPDAAEIINALLFWKGLTITLLLITLINGVLSIVQFFRRQPPLSQVLQDLGDKWVRERSELDRSWREQLKEYQLRRDAEACAHRHDTWTAEVDRRNVHMIKDAEERTNNTFEELKTDMRALGQTLGEVAKDVATLAGKVE
ncbi:MAG: hypothetical protein NTV49_05375 [Kiritimatiellaeota bacterium]|nr:hypothetical protein [Kiritimatiellota bacterium]